jgi:hypothetical protein
VQADKVDARVLTEIARRDLGARAVDPSLDDHAARTVAVTDATGPDAIPGVVELLGLTLASEIGDIARGQEPGHGAGFAGTKTRVVS